MQIPHQMDDKFVIKNISLIGVEGVYVSAVNTFTQTHTPTHTSMQVPVHIVRKAGGRKKHECTQ